MTRRLLPTATVLALLLAATLATTQAASGAQTILAYRARTPVTLDGIVQPGEWNDTPLIEEPTSGMNVAFKQNGTGLLFLLTWQQSSTSCYDQSCFGGIEIGNLNNTGAMGSSSTPTIMLLLSQSFKGDYDEFISTGYGTPTPVEQDGYATQSVCALGISSGNYTAECYRPFHLTKASPYDPFPSLAAGSPIEIGFAVGEFSHPGLHDATDMSTYVLQITDQTYTAPTTSTVSTSIVTSVGTSTQSTSQSSGPTSSWLSGFPGLNVTTLEIFAGTALLIGVLLGIGVALRARKPVVGK